MQMSLGFGTYIEMLLVPKWSKLASQLFPCVPALFETLWSNVSFLIWPQNDLSSGLADIASPHCVNLFPLAIRRSLQERVSNCTAFTVLKERLAQWVKLVASMCTLL